MVVVSVPTIMIFASLLLVAQVPMGLERTVYSRVEVVAAHRASYR